MPAVEPSPPVLQFSKQEVIVFDPTENTVFSFPFSAHLHPIAVADTFAVSGLNGPVTFQVYRIEHKIDIPPSGNSQYQIRVFTKATE